MPGGLRRELARLKMQFGVGGGLDRDVELLYQLIRDRSNEAVGEILKDYIDDDD